MIYPPENPPMKLELFIFGITAFLALNHYHDGKYLTLLYSWKKYYQVAGIVFGGLALYWILKKAPTKSRNQLLASTSEYIKYMPVDREASSWLNPILDFTSKQNWDKGGSGFGSGSLEDVYDFGARKVLPLSRNESKILTSGGAVPGQKTKRSVSESKKKWVAAYQDWKCGSCRKTLPAWFEIDHRIRLEHGGSNQVDNLVALCRECHGKKTMIENL